MVDSALSDLRVIELGDLISAPYCCKLMADMGADVIKIEPPGIGDTSRRYGPFPGDVPHPEKSLLYAYLNTSKRGITIDVTTKLGKRVFLDLVKMADVLVENNLPKRMQELGLDYESLKTINPRLIVTSITPFGQTGPYRDYRGTDLISMHVGGIGYATPGEVDEWEKRPPMKAPGHSGDFLAALLAASVTLLAVMSRKSSGAGQHVDVSQQESLATIMRGDTMSHVHRGETPSRIAAMARRVATRRPLACKDGYFSLQVFQDHFWEAMKKVMGNPDWADLELFTENRSRRDNLDALNSLLEVWASQYTKDELYQMLQVESHIPYFAVNTIPDLFQNDHLKAREFFVEMEHPAIGKFKAPGPPHRFSKSPWRLNSPAPQLGEHNQEIICGLLGYTNGDLVKMRGQGVI